MKKYLLNSKMLFLRLIFIATRRFRTEIVYCEEETELKEAVFNVEDYDVYVRVTVTDFAGKHANTNAYFVDELMEK